MLSSEASCLNVHGFRHACEAFPVDQASCVQYRVSERTHDGLGIVVRGCCGHHGSRSCCREAVEAKPNFIFVKPIFQFAPVDFSRTNAWQGKESA